MTDPAPPSSSLFAEVESVAGILTVKLLTPSLGQREAPNVADMVNPSIDSTSTLRWIVLDLSQARFMNSMALGMCVEFHKRGAAVGARTAIVGMNNELHSLFKIVRFDRLFTIAPDQAALAKKLKA